MFLFDSQAVFCAPAGCSLTFEKLAKEHGHEPYNPRDVLMVERSLIKNRQAVVLVCDPRTSLILLWRGWCRANAMEIDLAAFIHFQRHMKPFYRQSMTEHYRALLGLPLKLIRLEHFRQDVLEILGWDTTDIGGVEPWTDHQEIVERHIGWWRADAEAFGYF